MTQPKGQIELFLVGRLYQDGRQTACDFPYSDAEVLQLSNDRFEYVAQDAFDAVQLLFTSVFHRVFS